MLIAAVFLAPREGRAAIDYKTSFIGVDSGLAAELRNASQLVDLRKHEPASYAALRDRARRDLERLKTVLDSEGYYDATLDDTIDRGSEPYRVTVTVRPGPRYVIASAIVVSPSETSMSSSRNGAEPAAHGLAKGTPARAATILEAEASIVEDRHHLGWPFARIVDRRVVVDSATKTASVTYVLDLGPFCRFGAVSISGLNRLGADYVRRRILWTPGAVYDQRLVDKTRQSLIATSLFGAVAITPHQPARSGDPVDIDIRVKERARRSLTVGGGFDTSEGLEATFGWEHRNLFGGAEDLKADATVGQSKNAGSLSYRQPDFGAINRDLVASIGFDNEVLDAFHTISQQASIGIDWHLDPRLHVQMSVLADHARVNEIVDSRTYTLVGLPTILKWDDSDDALNPTTGYRLDLTGTPYLGALGSELTFLQMTATGTGYRKLDTDAAYVLAGQAMMGSSVGASLNAIPKDHRLYAGGGGSVRGFAYQKAGPLDSGDNPIGGRSLVETSLELRIRMTPQLGLVPFVDAGSDYASSFPDFSSLFEGVGIGLRYYSAIGPIRLDVATPLNPHYGDSPIQAYVGLGQAF